MTLPPSPSPATEGGKVHASPLTPHRSRFSSLAAALALGAAGVFGFAPFYLFPLPILALAGLFWLWRGAPPGRAAALGLAFGLGQFGAGVSWIYVSLHDFGAMPLPLAALATLLFCAYLALFPAAAGWLAARLPARPGLRPAAGAALWALFEWLRGGLLTGFPWLALGYSQVPASPLAGYAPLLGIYGVSLAAALTAALLTALAVPGSTRNPEPGTRNRLLAAVLLAALWLGGFALGQVQWTTPAGAPLAVSLLQGNVAQELKWRPDRVRPTLEAYLELARGAQGALVILPETALPLFLDEVPRDYLDALAAPARQRGGGTLLGIAEFSGAGRYYNNMVSLDGGPPRNYRKQHLVPFGEFIPVKPVFGWVLRVLHIPLSDFARGEALQPPLAVAGQKAAIAICYEDVFGEELIRQLPEATLLVNASNDAWFGRSLGPQQHLQIAQARALETGRAMLRATNTGVTAIIGPDGRVAARAAEFTRTVLEGRIAGHAGATPYVRWGNGAFLALAGLLLGAAVLPRRQ